MDIFKWFVDGWGLAALFAVAIAAWAVIEHVRYSRQFGLLEASIREGVGFLSSITDPNEFYQRYSKKSHALETNVVLGKRWKEYRATLLAARDDKPLRSPRPASEFFNEDLYRSSDIDVRAYESLPNQFVGVGLCLTFVGLIFSLFIAQNVIVASAEQATDELSNLLQAASFKFVTSVVALVASIIFVFAKNRRLYRTEQYIAAFCEQVARLIPPVTPEELAEESNAELERQGEQLAEANRTLAVGIADALEQKLTSAMVTATQPLIQTVQTMTERLSDMNRSALEHMAQRFSDTLAGAAREHSDRMAEMLKASADAIGEAPQQIRAASKAVAEEVKVGASAVETALNNWSERMTAATEAAASKLQEKAAEQGEFLATALRQEGTALLESISAVADELVAAPQQLTTAGETFAQAVARATGDIETKINEAGDNIAVALDGAAAKTEASAAAIERTMTGADAVAAKLNGITTEVTEQLVSIYKGAEALTGQLASLAGEVATAGDAAKSLAAMAERMEQLSADLGSGVRQLETLTELNRTTTSDTQLLVIKLGERAAAMEQELEGLGASLAGAFEKAGGGFDQLSERTAQYMAQLDSGMAKALERFGSSIRELDATIEKLAHQGDRDALAADPVLATVQAAE